MRTKKEKEEKRMMGLIKLFSCGDVLPIYTVLPPGPERRRILKH